MEADTGTLIQRIYLLIWRDNVLEISFTAKFKKDYKLCKKHCYDMVLLEHISIC